MSLHNNNNNNNKDKTQREQPQVESKDEKPGLDTCVLELSHVFLNMTVLLNRLRPHQARQALIHKMEEQVERRKAKVEQLESLISEAQIFLSKHGQDVSSETLDSFIASFDSSSGSEGTFSNAMDTSR